MTSRPSGFKLTAPGTLRLYSTLELMQMPAPTWLVDKVLPRGGVVCAYGVPGEGKTFVTLDVALSIAAGIPWQGMKSQKGLVVYIAAEGGFGIPQRVRAWCDVNHTLIENLNIAWLIESVLVNDTNDDAMATLIARIDEIGQVPVLIVIDTLARCFAGDENTQEDMGAFIAGVDRMRNEYGATVLVVHHTNVSGQRERGNTSLRGAADTMMKVSREKDDGTISVVCDKQKDAEQFNTMSLALQIVPQHMSAAVVPVKMAKSGILHRWLAVGPLSFKELKARVEEPGSNMSLATLKRTLRELTENGEIIKENGIYQESGVTPGLTKI